MILIIIGCILVGRGPSDTIKKEKSEKKLFIELIKKKEKRARERWKKMRKKEKKKNKKKRKKEEKK